MNEAVSRRGLFRGAAAAAVAAPLAGIADAQGPEMAVRAGWPIGWPIGYGDTQASQVDNIPAAARAIMRKRDRKLRRDIVLDADIDAAKSWAPWFRREVQDRRDEAQQTMLRQLLGYDVNYP